MDGRRVKMHIRSYQPSDKPALIEISKRTWGGHDELPSELDALHANPYSHLYVMEYNDRLVAFANLNVIDEGKTGWMEHMRVHWRYRKRGFAWAMTQFLISKAKVLGVERLRLTSTIENEATRKIVSRVGMYQVLKMKLFWKGNFRGIRWKDNTVPVESCTSDEAFSILNSQPALIPEGIITYYWHAFDFSRAFFNKISGRFQFWKVGKEKVVSGLSFGFQRWFRDAPLWCSTIYALDHPSFLSALSQQLQTAKTLEAQGVLCFHSLPFEAAHKIPGLKQNTFSTELVLFEKQRPFLR